MRIHWKEELNYDANSSMTNDEDITRHERNTWNEKQMNINEAWWDFKSDWKIEKAKTWRGFKIERMGKSTFSLES